MKTNKSRDSSGRFLPVKQMHLPRENDVSIQADDYVGGRVYIGNQMGKSAEN